VIAETQTSREQTTEDEVNSEIDAAYRVKYGRYGPRFLDPMVAPAVTQCFSIIASPASMKARPTQLLRCRPTGSSRVVR
jgi:hypothetical protein